MHIVQRVSSYINDACMQWNFVLPPKEFHMCARVIRVAWTLNVTEPSIK